MGKREKGRSHVKTVIKTWTDHLGHTSLRSFTDKHNNFWREQNPARSSKWAKLAREGHEMAWELAKPGGAYTGKTTE